MTLKLNGSSSGYTAIDAPAAAGSNTLVLPADKGSNGEFLQTNGSGTLDWAAPAAPVVGSVYWSVSLITTPQAISGSTEVSFNNELADSHNMVSNGVVTIASGCAGIYFLSGALSIEDASGYAYARAIIARTPSGGSESNLFRGDSRYRSSSSGVFSENTIHMHYMGQLDVGDSIRCIAQINSSGASPTIQAGSASSHFSGFRIA